MEDLKDNPSAKKRQLGMFDVLDVLEPGYTVAVDNLTAQSGINGMFSKMMNQNRMGSSEQDSSSPSYCFIFNDDESSPYVRWGIKDNEPFLYKNEIMHSGQSGAIIQRLVNMLTKQGVWHEVELPAGYEVSESEQIAINETINKVKAIYARLGLYNAGVGKDENGNYTNVHNQSAVIEMVNNLFLFNIAPLLISSKRKNAEGEKLSDRDFWQFTSVLSVAGEVFRYGKQAMTYSEKGGVRLETPFMYILPKPTFTSGDNTPEVVTALQAMTKKTKNKNTVIKTPAFNPNKVVVNDKGEQAPLPGTNLIECWAVKMDGVFDTGTYPIPIHSLGSFRNYRNLDYQLSLLIHNAILRGQHIRGIVRVYDIAYNSLDSYIDSGTDMMQSLKNRWEKDRNQVMKIFTGLGNAGGIVVLPGIVPSDAPQKAGTIEFTPVTATFDTSLIEAAYAVVKLELLSAFGIIDPRIVGVQLGKAGNLSDQAGLLEVAMEITKEFLETYVSVVNNFLTSFNEIAGISHEDSKGIKMKVLSGISIDTPYLKLFSAEMIKMLELANSHPNEVRALLGMDNKTDEELSKNLTMRWQKAKTTSNAEV